MDSSPNASGSKDPAAMPAPNPHMQDMPDLCKEISKTTLWRWKKQGLPKRQNIATDCARELYTQSNQEVLSAVDEGTCAVIGSLAEARDFIVHDFKAEMRSMETRMTKNMTAEKKPEDTDQKPEEKEPEVQKEPDVIDKKSEVCEKSEGDCKKKRIKDKKGKKDKKDKKDKEKPEGKTRVGEEVLVSDQPKKKKQDSDQMETAAAASSTTSSAVAPEVSACSDTPLAAVAPEVSACPGTPLAASLARKENGEIDKESLSPEEKKRFEIGAEAIRKQAKMDMREKFTKGMHKIQAEMQKEEKEQDPDSDSDSAQFGRLMRKANAGVKKPENCKKWAEKRQSALARYRIERNDLNTMTEEEIIKYGASEFRFCDAPYQAADDLARN